MSGMHPSPVIPIPSHTPATISLSAEKIPFIFDFPRAVTNLVMCRTWKRRQGSRQRWCKTSSQDPSRQHPYVPPPLSSPRSFFHWSPSEEICFCFSWSRTSANVWLVEGITKPAIRRLARRGGVKRISGLIYEEVIPPRPFCPVTSFLTSRPVEFSKSSLRVSFVMP